MTDYEKYKNIEITHQQLELSSLKDKVKSLNDRIDEYRELIRLRKEQKEAQEILTRLKIEVHGNE